MGVALHGYRSHQRAMPELLNWAAMIEPDVVLNKDGSLVAALSYRGNDLQTASDDEQAFVAEQMNAALRLLGNGWMLHVEASRVPAQDYPDADACHFPDPATELIDAERRAQFTGRAFFVTEYALFLTWLPPLLMESKVVDMLIDDGGVSRSSGQGQEQLVQQFRQSVGGIMERMGALNAVRLVGDALLTALHRSLTGLTHPVTVPPVAMFLDAVMGGYEFWTGLNPRVGSRYLQVVAVEGFPSASYPQMLAVLDGLDLEYRWTTRWISMDTVTAVGHLNRYRRKWGQKVRGFVSQVFGTTGVVNQDAVAMVQATEAALGEANSGLVGFGYYTSVIVLWDSDPQLLDEKAKGVRRVVNQLGFAARIESVNTIEAYLGSLPSHGVQNVRRPMMHTLNLSHLLPLSSVWPGEAVAPCAFYPPNSPPLMYAGTGGSTPFRLNLHVSDLGHTLMIGPTGSGKSTALAILAAQFRRYKNASVFAFDKGKSLLALTCGVNGQHFEISGDASDSSLHFAPLSRLKEPGWFGLLEDWCQGLFTLQGLVLSPEQKSELHRALVLMSSGVADRTLSALRTTVQDGAMKAALEPYTVSGVMGELLDSVQDGLSLSQWAVFEIEELMNRPDPIKLPVLLYLFLVIEKSLKGQPALLILDEAWLMLGHPVFKAKIREWLKVLRKANCAVVVATQSLSDAASSGILDVLTESCPTKILLANPEASSESNQSVYGALGLSPSEVRAISRMTPKREYFVKGVGNRVINLELGPVALAFCGVSDKENIVKIKQMKYNKGNEFCFYWLQERGVDYARYV